jgi:uncharacterized protein
MKRDNAKKGIGRRGFLGGGSLLLGGLAAAPFQALLSRHASGAPTRALVSDYGPLAPVNDQNTGLPLIKLPAGFTYTTFGWTGDPLADGTPTPGVHDGMAVVRTTGPIAQLIRNHEIRGAAPTFYPGKLTYDAMAGGGTTSILFDTQHGKFIKAWASIAGTSTNCAGGSTPWNSWITCEETVDGPAQGYNETHGWSFDVPANGDANPTPIKGMGRFTKEAIAVDPKTWIVYQTEDRGTSGFYRYTDESIGTKRQEQDHPNFRLSGKGLLEMLKVKSVFKANLGGNVPVGTLLDVEWVPIADPERAHAPGTTNTLGCFTQGRDLGGASFARLEGCWAGNGLIYFASTSGGVAGKGQIWSYDPVSETIELLYSSPAAAILDNPDNIAVSPRGGVILCEDGSLPGQRMHGLDAAGTLFTFAVNNAILDGSKNGFTGDFTGSEWAGATFTPDGKWLFANLQAPGITFAITGPWENGGL